MDMISFTVAPTGSRVLTLQDFTEPLEATVYWGDGSSSKLAENTALSHTYADESPRQVRIVGRLGGFWNNAARPEGTGMLVSLDAISSESLISLADTFRQCTGLKDLPEIITAPALTRCDRAFYLCKSINSELPYLWLSHGNATHTDCFTRCFLSCYGQYGTACPSRSYVDAVTAQTCYQKYGTGCSSASYVAAVAKKTYYQQYGTSCSSAGYVAGTSRKTYYNQYGTNCSSASYVAGTAKKTYYQQYGTSCPRRSYVITPPKTFEEHIRAQGISNVVDGCQYGGKKSVTTAECTRCGNVYSDDLGVYYCMKSPQITYTGTASGCQSCGNKGFRVYDLRLPGCVPSGGGCQVPYGFDSIDYYCSTSGGKCAESSCTYTYQAATSAYYKCGASSSSGVTQCSSSCNRTYQSATSAYYKCNASSSSGTSTCGSSCNRTYTAAQSAYYKCGASSSSGVTQCSSSCKRAYTSGQSAYYRCTRSNATCATDNCEYPYANEIDVTAARNAGWA